MQDILPQEYISRLEERNGKAMFCWHPCSVLALSSATSSSWTWFSGTKAPRLPYHSSLWLLSSLYGLESRSPSHLSEHILDSANPQLSNPSELIKFPGKFRISQFILNPFPASSWAEFSPLDASSFNSSSFSTAFGQARFTTCTDFFSLSLWFWSSHARKQQFCSATFIYVLRYISLKLYIETYNKVENTILCMKNATIWKMDENQHQVPKRRGLHPVSRSPQK